MLSTVSSHPAWLSLIQSTPAFPFLEGFVTKLMKSGYHTRTIQEHVRGAAHLSRWLEHREQSLCEHGFSELQRFNQHFTTCRCVGFKRRSKRHSWGASSFLRYLRDIGVIPYSVPYSLPQPPLLVAFCQWLRQHRGAKDATLKAYGRVVLDMLSSLGDDPARYNARGLRAFVLDRTARFGRSKATQLVTALRSFVRYLIAQGICPVGLDAAIPVIAGWKLASLPRYLPAAEVERVLASCDPATAKGARDRAALLLLSRLALRAGDVANLRWRDIDWHQATVEVAGKLQRAVRLPLSQEVGDALLHHLSNAPSATRFDHIFLRSIPPLGQALGSDGISFIASSAIARAGVHAPVRGAHVMRHSAATSLLAEGASLQSIGVVLRHRLLDTTAIYAKVDLKVLSTVARPWPEVSP
jgi:site-specific recombinase XerD